MNGISYHSLQYDVDGIHLDFYNKDTRFRGIVFVGFDKHGLPMFKDEAGRLLGMRIAKPNTKVYRGNE